MPLGMQFTAYGKPEPQGSNKAYVNRRTGRPIVTSDNPNLKDWRQQVGMAAQAAPGYTGALIEGPVEVSATFHLNRPKSRPRRAQYPDRRPDLDKLARGLLDAITGVLIRDDAQVCALLVHKRYAGPGEAPRVEVGLRALEEGD